MVGIAICVPGQVSAQSASAGQAQNLQTSPESMIPQFQPLNANDKLLPAVSPEKTQAMLDKIHKFTDHGDLFDKKFIENLFNIKIANKSYSPCNSKQSSSHEFALDPVHRKVGELGFHYDLFAKGCHLTPSSITGAHIAIYAFPEELCLKVSDFEAWLGPSKLISVGIEDRYTFKVSTADPRFNLELDLQEPMQGRSECMTQVDLNERNDNEAK